MSDKPKPKAGEQQTFRDVDPLRDTYRRSITHVPAVTRSLEHHKTALLCIDMQYLDAARGHGVFADAETSAVFGSRMMTRGGALRGPADALDHRAHARPRVKSRPAR